MTRHAPGVLISLGFVLWILLVCLYPLGFGTIPQTTITTGLIVAGLFAAMAASQLGPRFAPLAIVGVAAIVVGLEGFDTAFAGESPGLAALLVGSANDGTRIAALVVLLALAISVIATVLGLSRRTTRVPAVALLVLPSVALAFLLLRSPLAGLALPPLVLVAASLPIGLTVLRTTVGEAESGSWAWLPVCACLGLGAISLSWLAIGILGLLSPPWIIATLAAMLFWSRHDLLRTVTLINARAGLAAPIQLRDLSLIFAASCLLLVIAAIDIAASLAPDLANDSVNHHLAIAVAIARRASLVPSEETQFYYWHLPIQVLYAGLTAVSSPMSAKFLHFCFGALACTSIGVAASHLSGSRRAGLLAALLFAGTSMVSWLATTAYLDLGHVFLFTAATLAVCRWLETKSLGWLGVAGLCSGLAIPARLTNAVVVLAALSAIGVRERASAWRLMRASVVYGSLALLAWSPWLIRSFVLTGNPVFPWMNNVFRSPLVEPLNVFAGIPFGVGNDLVSLLRVPLTLTFQPEEFIEVGEAGRHYLALAPTLLILARRPLTAPLAFIAWTCILYSVLWFFFMLQNLRYLLPALALFAVLVAVAVERIRWNALRFSARSAVVAIAAMSMILSTQTPSAASWLRSQSGPGLPYRLILGLETPVEFLAARVSGFSALSYANHTYQGRAKIWAPYFGNRLYSDGPIVFNDGFTVLPLRVELAAIARASDPSETSRRLRQLGFTHMLINGGRPEFSLPDESRPAYYKSDFVDHYTELEFADNGMLLVRLLHERRDAAVRGPEMLPNPQLVRGIGGLPEQWDAIGHVELGAVGQTSGVVGLDHESRLVSRPIPVVAGRNYTLLIHAYAADGPTTGIFHLDFIDATGRAIPNAWVPFRADRAPQAFEMTATAPAHAASVRVILGVYDPLKRVWFADASVAEVGTR